MHTLTSARRLPLPALAFLFAACNNTPVTIEPPRVPQGGRALSIAVASTDDRRMAVTSETGGLFRTYNGGASWQHLDGLLNHLTIDVAIASLDPNTFIATAWPAYHTANDGGIWRSTDGGGTWKQPTGWAPKPGPGCPTRPGAYGISNMPLSTTFYVGTDCGVAISTDNGASWSNIVFDTTATGRDSLRNRVRSILVINRSSGVAATDHGLWNIGPNGKWVKSQDVNTSGQVPVIHSFASPWWSGSNPPIFYLASGGQMLWVSSDNGATWTQVPAPSAANREAFVRVARARPDDDSKFELWYGDGFAINHQTFSFSALTGTNSWDSPQADHRDPSDIAFDLDRHVPTLLATDGGVHATPDSGEHWTLIGSGYGGYEALQINEVIGQAVSGKSPHLDLYYSTQDNDLKASPDGGNTWDPHICCEGAFLRVAPTSVDHIGTRFTGAACGPCFVNQTHEHFTSQSSWPNAPDGNTNSQSDSPFLISGDSYLQDVFTPSPPTFTFFLTATAGGAWASAYSLTDAPHGPPLIVGPPANPTVYQSVLRGGALPNGGTRFGLVRITNVLGTPTVVTADSMGIGAIGTLHTPQAGYSVFGADPHAPSHLIAADVQNGEMVSSANSGIFWQPMPALTTAVTDSGRFLFTSHEFSFPTAIAWDPYDGCHILVGTMQNGVIESTDGGNTWARIRGSTYATYVSSFYFPPTGPVWVGTNGRGLWTMNLARTGKGAAGDRCHFPGSKIIFFPPDTIVVIDPVSGVTSPFSGPKDSVVCARCTIVVVRNGWITDLDRPDNTVKQIAISGGTISELDRASREVPLNIPNVYLAGDGRLPGKVPRSASLGKRRIRGLILDGTKLVRLIASNEEIPFAPARTPKIFLRGVGKGGGLSVATGDSVRVIGTGFVPSSKGGGAVELLLNGQSAGRTIPVASDGSFSTVLPVHQTPGELAVTATQRDGRRQSSERATINVVGNDPDESKAQRR